MANSNLQVPTNVPVELKALAPFLQRAQELKQKDPVMSYWCMYYAAQQGVNSKIRDKDSRPFLFDLMQTLETMRDELGTNEAIANDIAGAAYIENFAQKVFTMADNEDRRGAATRSTAKKFLAAANFLELLKIFDKEVASENDEKIRYSKWKAADIAKAYREGRVPRPGPADQSPTKSTFPSDTLSSSPPPLPFKEFYSSSLASSNSNSPCRTVPLPVSPHTNSTPLPTPSSPSLSVPRTLDPPRTPEVGAWSTTTTPGALSESGAWSNSATPGKWSTPATPIPIIQKRSATGDDGSDTDEESVRGDGWSTVGNNPFSRQASFAFPPTDPMSPTPRRQDSGPSRNDSTDSTTTVLGLQDVVYYNGNTAAADSKRVRWTPTVVGGMSEIDEHSNDGEWEQLHHSGADFERLPPLPESVEASSESGGSGSEWTMASGPEGNNRTIRASKTNGKSQRHSVEQITFDGISASSSMTITPTPSFVLPQGLSPGQPTQPLPVPLSPYHAAQTPLPPTVASSPDNSFGFLPHSRDSSGSQENGHKSDRGGHGRERSLSDLSHPLNNINTPKPYDHPSLPSFPVIPASSPGHIPTIDLPSVPNTLSASATSPPVLPPPPPPPTNGRIRGSSQSFPPPPPTNGVGGLHSRAGSQSVNIPSVPSLAPQPPVEPHSRNSSANSFHSFAPPPPPVPPAPPVFHYPTPYPPPPPPTNATRSIPSTSSTLSDSSQYHSESESEAGGPPTYLDPLHIAKVQKHAKFAISALNFEDLDTARLELRKALALLG